MQPAFPNHDQQGPSSYGLQGGVNSMPGQLPVNAAHAALGHGGQAGVAHAQLGFQQHQAMDAQQALAAQQAAAQQALMAQQQAAAQQLAQEAAANEEAAKQVNDMDG